MKQALLLTAKPSCATINAKLEMEGFAMILVTGDIHGEVHRVADAVARFGLSSEDIVVLLGDTGMNYYGNKSGDHHRKKRLNDLGVTMFCIHGLSLIHI